MYSAFLHSHSGLRWIFLAVILLSIIILYRTAFLGKNSKALKSLSLLSLILSHIQLLVGLVLYFISPKVVFAASSMKITELRFYLVEHISLMIIAVILITLGYVKYKKTQNSVLASKRLFTYYLIALIIVIVSIPWPFRITGAAWF